MSKLVTIRPNEENCAETWWEAARASASTSAPIVALLAVGGLAEIVVSAEQAEEILAWAAQLPGWDDGPEYAPEALLASPLDAETAFERSEEPVYVFHDRDGRNLNNAQMRRVSSAPETWVHTDDVDGYVYLELEEAERLLKQAHPVDEVYVAREESGATTRILADSIEEATEKAELWVLDGDYSNSEETVHVPYWVERADGEEEASGSVQIDPEEPGCEGKQGHNWQRAGGGCQENPGVYGIGGAAVAIHEVCARCGIERRTVVGDVNQPGNRNGVSYSKET